MKHVNVSDFLYFLYFRKSSSFCTCNIHFKYFSDSRVYEKFKLTKLLCQNEFLKSHRRVVVCIDKLLNLSKTTSVRAKNFSLVWLNGLNVFRRCYSHINETLSRPGWADWEMWCKTKMVQKFETPSTFPVWSTSVLLHSIWRLYLSKSDLNVLVWNRTLQKPYLPREKSYNLQSWCIFG